LSPRPGCFSFNDEITQIIRLPEGRYMKHKGYLLATAGSVAAAAGGAQAADLPVKARMAPPPPPPVASWTGFYVGVNAGANWQMSSATYGTATASPGSSLPAGNAVGFIGGGQIGYNWQISPAIVLGVEATIDGLTGKATAQPEFNTGAGKGNGFESQITWMATVRGRAGWLMNPDTLLYVTAGGAWAHVKDSANPNGLTSFAPTFTNKSVSKTKTGWVAGGGMEHMLNQNWSLGVEVLYADFGSSTGITSAGTKTTTFKNSVVSGTLKLNYKF
jgi:outer membrane immunogenic protein